MSAFGEKRTCVLRRKCLLLTQSGHQARLGEYRGRTGRTWTSQAVDFGDAPDHFRRRFIVGHGPERQCLSGSRPRETAREPGLEVRRCGKVHVDGAGNDFTVADLNVAAVIRANTFTQWICTAVYFCPGP
jgi:hypothetical protein